MKTLDFKLVLAISLVMLSYTVLGQGQIVKGQIRDLQSDAPLIGATILLIGSDPAVGAVTDLEGDFEISNVPVGSPIIRSTVHRL